MSAPVRVEFRANLRAFRVSGPFAVIDSLEGEGKPDDPCRIVRWVFEDGELIAVIDPSNLITTKSVVTSWSAS